MIYSIYCGSNCLPPKLASDLPQSCWGVPPRHPGAGGRVITAIAAAAGTWLATFSATSSQRGWGLPACLGHVAAHALLKLEHAAEQADKQVRNTFLFIHYASSRTSSSPLSAR